MKIALVHELLTMRGGAEKVLRIIADMFPEAPIYTLLYDEKKLGEWFPKERVRTSKLQKWGSKNHHLYLRSFPSAVEAWDFSEFDVVLSTSSAFVHGIITNGNPKHLCYVHSPARYLWDRTHDVLDRSSKGLLGPLRRAMLERTLHKLRLWDAEVAPRPDRLLAASKEVQRRIELYWRRESDVLYPPIDDMWISESHAAAGVPEPRPRMEHPDYFLIVSTLVPYKRIDLAIKACEQAKVHLKIVGEGPDHVRLQKLAGHFTELYGYRSSDELKDLFRNAKAVLFPGEEDFGLVPVEAMACGTPVIAYGKGGALETVVEHQTGEFFREPTAESLQQVIEGFDPQNYSKDALRTRAKEFSREKFERGIRDAIASL